MTTRAVAITVVLFACLATGARAGGCTKWDKNCSKCDTLGCTACKTGFTYVPDNVPALAKCYKKVACASNSFSIPGTGKCTTFKAANCKASGKQGCTSCAAGFVLHKGSYAAVPSTYGWGQCLKRAAGRFVNCNVGYTGEDRSDICEQCPPKFANNGDGSCAPCTNCAGKCGGRDACAKCAAGFFLDPLGFRACNDCRAKLGCDSCDPRKGCTACGPKGTIVKYANGVKACSYTTTKRV